MLETVEIVTLLTEASEVKGLPTGVVVGDKVGGRSFSDNVAAALERRSFGGWQDVSKGGEQWTLIYIEH